MDGLGLRLLNGTDATMPSLNICFPALSPLVRGLTPKGTHIFVTGRDFVRFSGTATFDDNGSQLEGAKGCDVTNDSNSEMRCKFVYLPAES